MSEYEALREAWESAMVRHRTHRSALWLGANGVYRCPQCDPPTLRERVLAVLRWAKFRVKRGRR